MTSKAESHEDMAETERLGSDMDKWSAGLIPIPASMVGRGGIHDTTWLTLNEARRLSAALMTLQAISLVDGE